MGNVYLYGIIVLHNRNDVCMTSLNYKLSIKIKRCFDSIKLNFGVVIFA